MQCSMYQGNCSTQLILYPELLWWLSASTNSVIEEVEEFCQRSSAALPASPHHLKDYCEAQKQDPTFQEIWQFCQTTGRAKTRLLLTSNPLESQRIFLIMWILFSSRIEIPQYLQWKTLEKIHQGHQGIERCLRRIWSSVWWPGITNQLKQMVQHCYTCAKQSRPRKEPLIPTELPEYPPWQVVGWIFF